VKNYILGFSPHLGIAVVAVLLTAIPLAHAQTAVLTLSTGLLSTNITENFVGGTGTVYFSGNVGIWSVNATGETSVASGRFELSLIAQETSSGPGSLTTDFSEINFTGSSSLSVTNQFAGFVTSGAGSISAQTYADPDNNVDAQTVALTSQGPYSGSFNSTISTNTSLPPPSPPFSLTINANVNRATSGGFSSDVFDSLYYSGSSLGNVVVPEPNTWVLCILGLAGLRLARRSAHRSL
jgi:hypothetical protein